VVQYVLGFEVTVEKTVLVQVCQPIGDLKKDALYLRFSKRAFRFVSTNVHLVQIGLNKVEHKVQFVAGENDFLELDNMRVIDSFERLDFSQLKTSVPS
jgi:hypothetical protein